MTLPPLMFPNVGNEFYNEFKLYILACIEECDKVGLRKADIIRHEFPHLYVSNPNQSISKKKKDMIKTMIRRWSINKPMIKLNFVTNPKSVRIGGGGRHARISDDIEYAAWKEINLLNLQKQRVNGRMIKYVYFNTAMDNGIECECLDTNVYPINNKMESNKSKSDETNEHNNSNVVNVNGSKLLK